MWTQGEKDRQGDGSRRRAEHGARSRKMHGRLPHEVLLAPGPAWGPERGSDGKTGARLVSGRLALYVPAVETRDVKPEPTSSRVHALDDHQYLGHDLPAPVARFPVAGPAPRARDVVVRKTAVGELFLNQETKGRLVHD